MPSRVVHKYLSAHAEPEAELTQQISERYDHLVVVPACAEGAQLIDGLLPSASPDARSLCVVVVNGGTAHHESVHEVNRDTLSALRQRSGARALPGDMGAWLGAVDDLDLLLVDRASAGARLPKKQGVGLARKIGCDIALALAQRGQLASGWIHMSDGDVVLPEQYFSASRGHGGAAMLAYPFFHEASGDKALDRAHAVYEIYLRYYVLGLRFADSPYAVHTIGSTLAINTEVYATVRGVPRREAAEDFYLVNKASKIGPVAVPKSEPIRIHARRSERVPFGTGRATADIVREAEQGDDYPMYHPGIFSLLRAWLSALAQFVEDGSLCPRSAALDIVERSERDVLARALEMTDSLAGVRRAVRDVPVHRRRARVHEQFDAFRTLKLVHALRDAGMANVPWREALHQAPFLATRELPLSDPFEVQRFLASWEADSMSAAS